jgi:hypothetical protein
MYFSPSANSEAETESASESEASREQSIPPNRILSTAELEERRHALPEKTSTEKAIDMMEIFDSSNDEPFIDRTLCATPPLLSGKINI